MLKPVNGHLLIDPVVHDSFIASQKETFEEIGVVLANSGEDQAKVGDKVFFDSWLAARYPKPDAKDGEFYWLVKWEDIRAIEHPDAEPQSL